MRPIGFTSGLTGALFREFAFTLAGAVIVSGIVALTLSPMMTSKMLKPHEKLSWFGRLVERVFGGLQRFYRRRLDGTIKQRAVFAWIAVLTIVHLGRALQRHQPRTGAGGRPGRALRLRQRARAHQPRLSHDLYRRPDEDLPRRSGEAEPLRHQRLSQHAFGLHGPHPEALGRARALRPFGDGRAAAEVQGGVGRQHLRHRAFRHSGGCGRSADRVRAHLSG